MHGQGTPRAAGVQGAEHGRRGIVPHEDGHGPRAPGQPDRGRPEPRLEVDRFKPGPGAGRLQKRLLVRTGGIGGEFHARSFAGRSPQAHDLSAEKIIEHIREDVAAFARGAPQGDDMTAVVIRVL